MADPSFRVAPQLLAHLHLISQYTYPFHPQQLPTEKALQYLQQASRITREIQPVSWQILLQPPIDGTVFLAWQPTAQRGTTFATDGYIWAGPETPYTKECQGWIIESFVEESGFIPNIESIAVHRRIRSRLLRGPNGQSADPQLEIVQYLRSRPEHELQANQIRPSQQQQKLYMDRQQLLRQGPLSRKQFMLHDVQNWPPVQMPGPPPPQMIPGNPYQPPVVMGGRPMAPGMPPQMFAQPPQQPSARSSMAGPSPAKRARTGTISQSVNSARGSVAVPPEDAVFTGDDRPVEELLDMLSPREISITRWRQHQEWMEEILSVYDVRDILPVGLGLGLTGDLASITNGVIEKESEMTFKPVTKAQSEELEKRVSEFQRKGLDELETMRQSHQLRLQEFKQQKSFANFEKQLAGIGPRDHAKVEEIATEAEKSGSINKVLGHDEVVRIAKGGLLAKGEEVSSEEAAVTDEDGNNMDAKTSGQNGHAEDDSFAANQDMIDGSTTGGMFGDYAQMDNTAGAELDFYEGMEYS